MASLRITFRTHWSCDYICDNQGYFLLGTLNSSQTVYDVFAEVHPGVVFIVHQDVQNILRPFDFIIEEIAWSVSFEMAQIQDYTSVEFQADNNS